MSQRTLGNTDTSVNGLAYGAMHLSIDRSRRPEENDSIALLQRIVDELGVELIDTADAYCADDGETGHNERLISTALKGERRQRVVIATKGGSVRPNGSWERNGRPEHLRSACEASLRALDTDRIDLYQLHAPDPNVPVSESIGALADLQREGKIRWIGVSNFSLPLLEAARKEATIVSLQNQFSVINQREESELLRYCEKEQITYFPWNPVGGRGKAPELDKQNERLLEVAEAHGTGAHEVALAWLLALSPAMIPIPGSTKFDHVKENMNALELTLTAEEIESLTNV
jgi:aryl-alcohol dehydrogenase-like predicted oxidoreductase